MVTKTVENSTNDNDFIEDNLSFWKTYEQFLTGFNNKKTIYSRLSYAKRYYKILINGDFNSLHSLSKDKRSHVMKALTSLSKYLGVYDKWKKVIERFNFKWYSNNSIETFERLVKPEENIEEMIDWVKDTYKKLPKKYGDILVYSTLTGLRASESLESISLLRKDKEYLDIEKMILKHYSHPSIFIRRTKKAYISVVNEKILQLVKCDENGNGERGFHQNTSITYSALRSYFKRNKMKLNLHYCRKIFATFLRQNGIEQEIIDLLQGRASNSIFLKHYYRPIIPYHEIKSIIHKLYDRLVISPINL